MVRNEDERAQALRNIGAEVLVGDLFDLDSMHRVIDAVRRCTSACRFRDTYLAATVNVATAAKVVETALSRFKSIDGLTKDRTLEIQFLDPGAEPFSFTFG